MLKRKILNRVLSFLAYIISQFSKFGQLFVKKEDFASDLRVGINFSKSLFS